MIRLSIVTGALLLAAGPAHAQFAADAEIVGDAELRSIAGRENLQRTTQTAQTSNTSTVSNNTISGTLVNGAINFDGSAFQNLTGLSVLSANTGNNVSINAAMNVNVSISN